MKATAFSLNWNRTLRRLCVLALVLAGLAYITSSPWLFLLPSILVIITSAPRFIKASRRGVLVVDDSCIKSPFFGSIRCYELEDVQILGSSHTANSMTASLARGDRFLIGSLLKAAGLNHLAFPLRKKEEYLSRLRQPSRFLMQHYVSRSHGGPTLDLGLIEASPEDIVYIIRQHWRGVQASSAA